MQYFNHAFGISSIIAKWLETKKGPKVFDDGFKMNNRF